MLPDLTYYRNTVKQELISAPIYAAGLNNRQELKLLTFELNYQPKI